MLDVKLQSLRTLLSSYDSCLVAYSGGVDSVFLAFMAKEVLGAKALAAIADSPSLPRRELEEGIKIARQFSIPLQVVRTREFENPSYLSNPANRCYFCKNELFTELEPLARAEGFKVIAYGENASDVGDYRAGALAAAEFKIRAPLKEAGLTKSEIRELSAHFGLPTADKPQMACLSSRIPTGERVTPEKLRMIEEAEYLLRDLGFYDVRVRHHESNPPLISANPGEASDQFSPALVSPTVAGPFARIELGINEIPRLLQPESMSKVTEALKKIGYVHVTLDLQGYRRGKGVMSNLTPPTPR